MTDPTSIDQLRAAVDALAETHLNFAADEVKTDPTAAPIHRLLDAAERIAESLDLIAHTLADIDNRDSVWRAS